MEKYAENNSEYMKAGSFRGLQMMGACGVKIPTERGNNRRALRDIRNIVGTAPFPSAIAKGGLVDKSMVDENNSHQIPPYRPMTRNFAASLANRQPLNQVVNKKIELQIDKKLKIIPNSRSMEKENADTYVEMEPDDIPSFVAQTEAMLEEMETMDECALSEETEMDLEVEIVETVMNIDQCDRKNPLAVADYVEEIYRFYKQKELSGCASPNYMFIQQDINEKMRAILIDWLIEVHYKFELMDETLFLTVNLIDRFLERQTVIRKKLQLVGVTAMLIACKYEEVSIPVVEDLILISDKAYTRDEVLTMEKLMVNALEFNLSVPTPYVFMRRFLKAAQSDKKMELISFFLIELCLVEYVTLKYPPSMLAAAAIYTAQCTANGFRHWSKTSEWHTGYKEEHLQECSRMMVEFHIKAAEGKLTGVHRKYSIAKFGFAARAKPALFLLGKSI